VREPIAEIIKKYIGKRISTKAKRLLDFKAEHV